ncbi:MAG: ABC transporter substrate-binding protein [Acetobacteraceae bacterium]|nr:ABC transporter substrate-binding protein [Acetobacteraceae bacterium]
MADKSPAGPGALARRTVLAGATSLALSAPSLSRAQRRDPRVLRFIPNTGLTVLDPFWTASLVTGNHGYHVWDTLYGTRGDYTPGPQMAEGHTVNAEYTDWRIRLRPDLWFHDGTPVLARDCVASLRRWAKRDSFGAVMWPALDELVAEDDRTLRFRFKRRFPRLLEALGRTSGLPAFIMPERFGAVDAFTAIKEVVGSGPFTFVADAFVPGATVAYAKFDKYVPRQDAPNRTTGAKIAHFDRVEWTTMTDNGTAVAAMQSGEMDWWESTPADLRDLVRGSRNLKLEVKDEFGWMGILRFNLLQPPFDNVKLRRAFLAAANQHDFLRAAAGEGEHAWQTCRAYFPCGAPSVTQTAGTAAMPMPDDLAAARKAIAEAGYNGEKVVLLVPTDIHHHNAFGQVSADLIRRLGMNLDFQAMDWGTMIQRITNRGPVEKGGWNLYHTAGSNVSMASPALNFFIRGDKGWTGWYENAEVEKLRAAWRETAPDEPQQPIFDAIQQTLFNDPPFVPLGQYSTFTTFNREISGVLPGIGSYPWNIKRG